MSFWDEVTVEEFEDSLGADVRHFLVTEPRPGGIRGFGSARTPELALRKAIGAMCERAAFRSFLKPGQRLSSNGFASHRSPETARQAAISELIERDAVMTAWLTKSPPEWLSDAQLPLAFRTIVNAGFHCRLGLLAVVGGIHVFVSLIYPKDNSFGCLFASAAALDPQSAVETVYLNQRRNLTYAISTLKAKTSSFPDAERVKEPDDHRRYYLNPENRSKWQWLLESGTALRKPNYPEIEFADVVPPFSPPWPVSVARAQCHELQDYFVGIPKPDYINWDRLSALGFSSSSSINPDLHPLP